MNAAVNYTGSYNDTNIIPTGRIHAYTTIDLNGRYTPAWLPGLRLGLGVTNLFDRKPPLTAPALYGLRYDPSNADPVGRVVSFELSKTW